MKYVPAPRFIAATLAGTLLLGGCSLFNDPGWKAKRDAEEKARVAAAAVPAVPQPVPTHTFPIDANTDIVGVVQKTVVGKDDTLTDIARRFNVGYEEIVRANPGMDPWSPARARKSSSLRSSSCRTRRAKAS